MGYLKVAKAKDVEPGNMMGVEADAKTILLANVGGVYYAIGNRCTHMGCMLSDGTLQETTVKCLCHGSIFDLKTGSVMKPPARQPEPVYEVKVDGEEILVNV